MRFSFQSVLAKLADLAVAGVRRDNFEEPEKPHPPTSIRLRPRTKAFIDATAEAMGLSAQNVIGLMLDGVAETSLGTGRAKAQIIIDRFHLVFDRHQLDLPSTSELLAPYGITRSMLRDEDRLIDALSPEVIRFVSKLFHIGEEWLRGASDRAVNIETLERQWYKSVETIATRMLEYRINGLSPQLMIVRQTNAAFERALSEDSKKEEPVGAVLRLPRATSSGVAFQTFDVLQFERWNYWRCREQIKLLIMWADAAGFEVTGHELAPEEIQSILNGHDLPCSTLSRRTHVRWYPTDYASLRHKVTEEVGGWPSVLQEYKESAHLQALLSRAER